MKRYIRSNNSISSAAADQIQRFIDGYGFSKFFVYPRTDEYLAIDVEGEDEDEVISLLSRLHAWGLDADIYDHYIEINIADDNRFNDAVTASDAMNPGWSKRYDSELQQTYYVLAIPGKTATAVHFDDDGDFGYEVTLSGKAINKERKTFHGDDALDEAMTWAEKKLYKESVTSATGTTKSWTDYLPEDVYNRLAACSTRKSDIKTLVDAKWRRMKELGKDQQGFIREDALVSVLDLLDSNSCNYELTVDEYDDLKRDLNVRGLKHEKIHKVL